MSKRGLPGQLNLFDFWGDANSEDSIVEMVSLVPDETEVEMVSLIPDEPESQKVIPDEPESEKVISDEPETKKVIPDEPESIVQENSALQEETISESCIAEEAEASFGEDGQPPVMHKEAKDKEGRVLAEISYLNYNKVYIKNKEYRQGKLFEFENSKEAVDFYISEMMKLTGE